MNDYNRNYALSAVIGGAAVGIALSFPSLAFGQISGADARGATMERFRQHFGTSFDSTGIMYSCGADWDTLAWALALNQACGYQFYLGKNIVVTPNMAVDSSGSAAEGFWVRKIDTLAIANIDTVRAIVERFINWAIDGDSLGTDTLGVAGFPLQAPEPNSISLANRPNPFSARTTFTYAVPLGVTSVVFEIYNVAEQLVASFNARASGGKGSAVWNGMTDRGTVAPAGIYFARMRALDMEKAKLSRAAQQKQYRDYITKKVLRIR